MAACRHFLKNSATKPMRLRFSIRHRLWLTLVVALAVGWITGGTRQTKSLAAPESLPRPNRILSILVVGMSELLINPSSSKAGVGFRSFEDAVGAGGGLG